MFKNGTRSGIYTPKNAEKYIEKEVDIKYYLTEKQLEGMKKWKSRKNPLDNIYTKDSEYISIDSYNSIYTDCNELIKLLVSIVKTSKNNQ